MLFTISAIDTNYEPAVISLALFSNICTFTEDFSIKNSHGKSSIPRYLNLRINLNN